ncbi:hypothetical protein LEP48_04325 [Isoptericola sp. NEAU-Y5]|uniref:Uncharacterized protein n=1 Tax=Isoptericola luteus TaxID=2879484 RepID=A0ABS7ZFL0_9MICO|nr:hypothetical protein [Isoptericola sp. NEAU-Y5]MCA5892580.1 hypothetical protein [Isoptericola sp. NEAU-Y5]
MSDDKPTTPLHRDGSEEVDETQALPAADETQALPAADETQALPAADETQALPAADETRALPVAGPDDPLSVFDRPDPRPSGEPAPSVGAPPFDPGRSTERSSAPASPLDRAPAPASARSDEPARTAPVKPPVSSGPRSSTIVWGFLVVAFGVGLLANAAGARIDIELAAIVLLAAAGVLLVVGSAVSALRRRRQGAPTP